MVRVDPVPAPRLVTVAILFLVALVLALAPISGLLAERFGGGAITLRPWMIPVNAAIAGTHGLALAVLWLGLRAHGPRLARWALAVGALAATADALFPVLVGPGPHAPDGWQVGLFRTLAFLPSVARAAAFLGLALAITGSPRLRAVLIPVFGADLAFAAFTLADTPLAVMARVHASPASAAILVPWALAGLGLTWALRRPAAG